MSRSLSEFIFIRLNSNHCDVSAPLLTLMKMYFHSYVFISELKSKLEANIAIQEELKNKVEQTAVAVEEVTTTMTKGT